MHYSFKSTSTFTLKSRTQTVTKSNQPSSVPGPGDYNVVKPLPKSATVAQTTQKRQLWNTINYGPGPGSYKEPSYITSGQKRSMSARIIPSPSKVPGPAAYQTNDVKNLHKSPVYSMGNKSKSARKIIEDHNLYKPSPVNYQNKSSFQKPTKIVFGSSNRKDLTETERTPAPNHYMGENKSLTESMNPRCAIGTEKRELKISIVEKTPGPGQYEKKTFFEENQDKKKGFTCREKVRDLIAQQIAKFPAPGQYKSENFNLKSTAPRPVTTSSKRLTFIDQVQSAKKDIPAFTNSETNFFSNSNHRASSAYPFSRSNRKPLDENQITPGPVAYSSDKLQVMNKQPHFSYSKTVPKNEFLQVYNPENPGPGAYDAKIQLVKSRSGSVIVNRENRPGFEKEKLKPGVGEYNLVKEQKPKFGWTKEKRISFTDLRNQAKNATHYNLNTNFTQPPSYMNVTSKIQFSPTKSNLASTGF